MPRKLSTSTQYNTRTLVIMK